MPVKPTEELEGMPSTILRIEAVARDFCNNLGRYAGIPGRDLARLLGLDLDDRDAWFRGKFVRRSSLDDYLGEPTYYIAYLNGAVPVDRYNTLMAQSKAFEEEKCSEEPRVSAEERRTIENKMSQERVEDCPDLEIMTYDLDVRDDISLAFEAVVGDWGEVEEVYGPYEIRDGKGVDWAALYEGESCY